MENSMVGDDIGEKVVGVGFRAAEKLTPIILKAAFELILIKICGGTLKGTYHLSKIAAHDILQKSGFDNTIGVNKVSLHKLEDKQGFQVQGTEVTAQQMCGFDKYVRRYRLQYSLVREANDPKQYFFSSAPRIFQK